VTNTSALDTRDALRHALDRMRRDDSYSARLAAANALDNVQPDQSDLEPIHLILLRDITAEPLVPALRAELASNGFIAGVQVGDFDTITRDALDSPAGILRRQHDLIVILRWLEQVSVDLATKFVTLDRDGVSRAARGVVDRVERELTGIRARSHAPVLLNSFALPDLTTLGILDAQIEGGHREAVDDLNREIARLCRTVPDVYLVDMPKIVSRVGSRAAIDERGWLTSRAPLGTPLIVALAKEYAKFVRALRGRVRKCLILDCDDTLWGGVVGEDGLAGIRLDLNYPGSPYRAFQREVLNLRERGVLLALVSKNNEADVLEVLRQHPSMLIRESDLAGWRINWEDKATNIEALSAELGLGLDSFVFADDSEFECELVRQRLPMVAVLHLGNDASGFATKLTEPGWFDSLTYSTDDRSRTDMVVADRARAATQASADSLDEYLAGLDMRASIGPPTPADIPRVAQLTQKTNQFNLTTVRMTEGEVVRIVEDESHDIHVLRLRDRFSDLGLVAIAIVGHRDQVATIETLLMSCRVLGRGVEDAFLAHVAGAAAVRGAIRLVGLYRPTKRNEQVAAFYPMRGFRPIESDVDTTRWELDLQVQKVTGPKWVDVRGLEGNEGY
jgi:FkbH-like protein